MAKPRQPVLRAGPTGRQVGPKRQAGAPEEAGPPGVRHTYHSWSDRPLPEWVLKTLKEQAERSPTHEDMKGAHLSALYLQWQDQEGIWGGLAKPAIPILQLDIEEVAGALRELGQGARLKVLKGVFREARELADIAKETGLSEARARTILNDLLARGKVVRVGLNRYRAKPQGQGAFFDALLAAASWLEHPRPEQPERK
jgi:hypothetical protein